MTLEQLRQLRESGRFDHATYRDQGTIWEGLWIYERDPAGFRGYVPAGCFPKSSPDLDAAYELVGGTGISIGQYGVG